MAVGRNDMLISFTVDTRAYSITSYPGTNKEIVYRRSWNADLSAVLGYFCSSKLKLGPTNERIYLQVATECIMHENLEVESIANPE